MMGTLSNDGQEKKWPASVSVKVEQLALLFKINFARIYQILYFEFRMRFSLNITLSMFSWKTTFVILSPKDTVPFCVS